MQTAGIPRAGGRSCSPPRRRCSAPGAALAGDPRSGTTPGWAKAAATGAIIVGLVGAVLAVLTIVGVFGGHLTAPATAG